MRVQVATAPLATTSTSRQTPLAKSDKPSGKSTSFVAYTGVRVWDTLNGCVLGRVFFFCSSRRVRVDWRRGVLLMRCVWTAIEGEITASACSQGVGSPWGIRLIRTSFCHPGQCLVLGS